MTAPYPYSAAASPRYRPGPVALLLVVAGLAMVAIGFFALPWVSEHGVTVKFTRLRDLYDAANGKGLAPVYMKWLGFAGLAAAGVCGLLAACGGGTAAASNTLKAIGALAAGGAGILHLVAMNKIYLSGLGHAPAGPWVILAGYGAIVIGALIGARPAPSYGSQAHGYHGYGGYPGY
ncbi:MAG: hypothetical protein ACJ73S_19900 [Mycobacteriales bacterium]